MSYISTITGLGAGAVAGYLFDEAAATGTCADSIGTHTGTVVSGITQGVAGLMGDGGKAITGAAAAQISVSSSADFNFGSGAFWVVGWVKTTAAALSVIIGESTGNWYVYTNASGKLAMQISGGAAITSVTAVNDGTTHFFAVTRDGSGNLNLYLDGNTTADATGTSAGAAGTAAGVGIADLSGSTSFPFVGTIDGLAVGKGSNLTGAQANTIYNAGLTGGASFTITGPNSATTLPSNHAGNITVSLVGTGTTWTGSTTFAASGVTGWSVASKTFTDATHYTVVLTPPTAATPPAGATGTLTLTEGVTGTATGTITVSTPTLAISPTSGTTSTTPTLTLTGTNTLWQSETAAGLFTVTGGTGSSLATPTVTTNAAATDVLTVGTAAGSLTIKDASTGATATFTASVGSTTIAVTDANWYHSPHSTYGDGAGAMQANNLPASSTIAAMLTTGAYGKVTVQSTGNITLNIDQSRQATGGAAADPLMSYSLDSGAWTDVTLTNTSTGIAVLTSGTVATHTLIYRQKGNWAGGGNKWTGTGSPSVPQNAVVITGLAVDTGATTAAPTLGTKRAVFYGDSIVEGVNANADHSVSYPTSVDAVTTHFCRLIAVAFNAEFGQIGYGGTGFESAGVASVPAFSSTYNLYFATKTRAADSTVDYVFVFHGTNGTTTQTDVSTMAANLRTLYPNAWIFFVLPPTSQGAASALAAGVAAAADAKCKYLAAAAIGTGGAVSSDGTHPYSAADATYGAEVIRLAQAAMGGSGGLLLNPGMTGRMGG